MAAPLCLSNYFYLQRSLAYLSADQHEYERAEGAVLEIFSTAAAMSTTRVTTNQG